MALFEKKEIKPPIPPEQMPKHVGFSMDGNGRWAKKRGMPRTFGHKAGGEVYKKIMQYCRDIGIQYASFYVFSTENWARSQAEIEGIFRLMREGLIDVQPHVKEGVRWILVGDRTKFPQDIQDSMTKLEEDSKDNTRLTSLMCCNYGGRAEITHSVREIAELVKQGKLDPADITEDTVNEHLYTAGVPDVDLIIRPSGELRLSNFLIWQSAYAEYYFTDILWPDFTSNDLDDALRAYAKRGRRFGGAE